MITHPSALTLLLGQLALASVSAPSVAAVTHTCDSVVFYAEVYADEAISVEVHGDDVKKYCDFRIEDDSPLGEVSCEVVDVLAQVHAPKELIIGVFESGFEKICQFSINGSLRSASADTAELPEQVVSFEDGVQAGLAYLDGIQEYALAVAQHDIEKIHSASVQIIDSPADLIGSNVVNETGETLGELSGFAVNYSDNAPYAVVEVGGFFGIGASERIINLDKLRFNKSRQLMVAGATAEQLDRQAAYATSDYEDIDILERMEQGLITTIPSPSPLAYLFASSNVPKGQESEAPSDLLALHGQVNRYHSELAACLYRFYAGLSIGEDRGETIEVNRDDFSCVADEEDDELEMSIQTENGRYRLVVFRQ